MVAPNRIPGSQPDPVECLDEADKFTDESSEILMRAESRTGEGKKKKKKWHMNLELLLQSSPTPGP